jgi:hypothetical protein
MRLASMKPLSIWWRWRNVNGYGRIIGACKISPFKEIAQSRFGLSLPIGAVPVNKVRLEDIDVLVGKFCLSPGNYLAVFTGGGVGFD